MQQWHAIVLIHFLGSSWDRRESPPGASSASRNPGWPPGDLVSRCRSCWLWGEGSYGTATSCNPAWVDSRPNASQASSGSCWLYPLRRICSRRVAWGRYRDLDRNITESTQASRNLELWRFVNADSFLLFDLLGWSKEDLDLFLQPCSTWRAAEKFNHFCVLAENISLLNDNVERCKISHVLKMQYIFRLIKLVKDRIRTVHAEHRLQDVLITVAALRKRCAGFKASDFNTQELRTAIRQVLKLWFTPGRDQFI